MTATSRLKMPIFFLGGVHGTGKSSLASAIGVRVSATVLSASQLIRDEGFEPSEADKRVHDIDGNQERLLRALTHHRKESKKILLDGHYCLRSVVGDAVAIPVEVFKCIAPTALLLLVDEPVSIVQRLKERDGVTHQVADVTALMECEREAALVVSNELRIALRVLNAPPSIDDVCQFLDSVTA